jgi:hypothetical protein
VSEKRGHREIAEKEMREGGAKVSRQSERGRSGRKLGCGLLVVALTFVLGCSSDNIMGPAAVATPGEGGSEGGGHFNLVPDPEGEFGIELPGAREGKATCALVSAENGGVVSLGRFTLEFPPGALAADTEIEISVTDPTLVMCELGPHGLEFNKPVTLTIDYGGTPAEQLEASSQTLGVYWYNEATGRWQLVGRNIDVDRNLSRAQLEHFSDYAQGFTQG